MWSASSIVKWRSINTSHPRISQASSPSDIDSREAPADAVGPAFSYRADSVVPIVVVAVSAASNIAVAVNLHSGVCVAVLTASAVHGQPIQSTTLPSDVRRGDAGVVIWADTGSLRGVRLGRRCGFFWWVPRGRCCRRRSVAVGRRRGFGYGLATGRRRHGQSWRVG